MATAPATATKRGASPPIAKLPELLKRRSPSMRLFQMHHLTGLS